MRTELTMFAVVLGSYAFSESGIVEISIPDPVREICERCFYRAKSLKSVTFGCSSHLEVIGALAKLWRYHVEIIDDADNPQGASTPKLDSLPMEAQEQRCSMM